MLDYLGMMLNSAYNSQGGQPLRGGNLGGRIGSGYDPGSVGGGGPREPQQLFGAQNAGGIGRDGGRPGMMGGGGFDQAVFSGGPIGSEFPGSSYKTRGNAPRYHEEIPMGGTPGVWAIRNDEIGGPRSDPFQNMSPREWADSISSGIGRRFKRRYR